LSSKKGGTYADIFSKNLTFHSINSYNHRFNYWIYFETKISKITFTPEFTAQDVNVHDTAQIANSPHSKVAIALFELDARYEGEHARSDTIMLLLIDHSRKKIKIASIMRDLYVDVPGHGKRKINSAYELNGPKLALSTLNLRFELPLTKYVTVDFRGFEKIIDAVGGVDIEVKDYEVEHINMNMREMRNLIGREVPEVKRPGLQHLNGRQALGYARIRYVVTATTKESKDNNASSNKFLKK